MFIIIDHPIDLICSVLKVESLNVCFAVLFLEQSAVLIESSTQTIPRDRKSEDDTTKTKDSKTEWSEEEKNRLLDALKKYYFVVLIYCLSCI